MKRIELGKRARKHKGYFALVDDCDFEELSQYNWYAKCDPVRGVFIAARRGRRGGCSEIILMHRQIMGFPVGMMVDHVNHQTLDNRRLNLRIATRAQNKQNSESKAGASQYKGVVLRKCLKSKPWNSKIVNPQSKKQLHLGCFATEEEAAKAYDRAAAELFGEFACLNFPQPAGAA